MNVLLLTPDRVGSTLLQRTLTIYMLRRGFDKPVINLHELTNGLEKYYNTKLNQEVLGKPKGTDWGYYQNLNDVTELLKSSDHYKTSRLAHYHIKRRGDSIADQLKFYEYLNNNFFIISCRRKNIFEHGLSWAINGHSKKLNVYSVEEKINTFDTLYKQGLTVHQTGFIKYLNAYKDYVEWSDKFFNIQSYFNYEDSINDLESYILNLDFMQKEGNSWDDMFGIDFDTWNKCHKIIPDLALYEDKNSFTKKLTTDISPKLLMSNKTWDSVKGSDWPDTFTKDSFDKLPGSIKTEIMSFATTELPIRFPNNEIYEFINNNINSYLDTTSQLHDLVENGFLVSSVPIKLQTLSEKKNIINNYDECIMWYNEWAASTGFGDAYSEDLHVSKLEAEKFQLTSSATQQLLNNTKT